MGNYAAIATEIWVPEKKIEEKLFDEKNPLLPMEL